MIFVYLYLYAVSALLFMLDLNDLILTKKVECCVLWSLVVLGAALVGLVRLCRRAFRGGAQ